MKKNHVVLISMGIFFGVVIAAVVFNWKLFAGGQLPNQSEMATATSPVQGLSVGSAASAPYIAGGAPNYRAIVERYGSAVVGITTEGVIRSGRARLSDPFGDDPFFGFFRGLPGLNGNSSRDDFVVRGQGSGFVISRNGLILTNAHVVKNADEVVVKLSDRREFKAKVLGSDKVTDVALLKINADNLPAVVFGDPALIGVGDFVLAIGSPFGFEQSATAGIVSAKGRSLPGDIYVPFIQTDVAVNPGNSGGPLFDASGAVIGINSQIYSKTGGFQGVSFAIPINVALRVKDQILETGKVVHAKLGVSIQELEQALAESFKLPRPEGALIVSVEPDSGAAKAGIVSGDIILKYNAQTIVRAGDLPSLVGMDKPGKKIELEVWRAGKRYQLNVVLGGTEDTSASSNSAVGATSSGRLEISARPLMPEEKEALQLSSGLVVEHVTGRAARAGIIPGDIIISVNGMPVKTLEKIQGIISKGGKRFAFLVMRNDMRMFIPVGLE